LVGKANKKFLSVGLKLEATQRPIPKKLYVFNFFPIGTFWVSWEKQNSQEGISKTIKTSHKICSVFGGALPMCKKLLGHFEAKCLH
jgi:hypothetical protein